MPVSAFIVMGGDAAGDMVRKFIVDFDGNVRQRTVISVRVITRSPCAIVRFHGLGVPRHAVDRDFAILLYICRKQERSDCAFVAL
ncbi:hypothetical protein D3872_00130 [Massilia cavernae]|uniref:Uncharacterized protein n=1 Tax=Massilia cavernae TaxID=2320864 RepID=A0A418Y8P8_9BURK|nr:hypothetical protein D3872_00130 [Massilia cavernae]